jgi:predicted dinucleotide-binding enzyme
MNLNPAFLKNRSSNAGLLISRAAYLESIAQIQGLARRKEQMKIGILGAGRIGAVAARLFVVAGHDVAVSNSRGPESLRELVATLGPRSHASDIAGAAAFGELVLLAVPWHRAEALPAPELLRGKIVIDAMNPYRPEGGFYDLGLSTSSEEVLKRIPGVRLVKAFNTIYYEHLAGRGRRDLPVEERHAIYVAGDDPAAKAMVERLIEEIGFAPVDTGSLREGGRLQQPDSPIYNQTFTAREARAFFRNELHRLTDVLPDAALPLALESLGRYRTWPPLNHTERT